MNETEKTVINISAVSKWKRFLLFLADFFICGIMSAIIYNLLVYPILYITNDYDIKGEECLKAEDNISLILEKNNILYGQEDDETLSDRLEYTFKEYLLEYVEEKENKTYEVFKTYYVSIKSDQAGYKSIYEDFGSTYFDISESSITLKSTYVDLFSPLLNPQDGLSEEGESEYETMQNKFFLVAYSRVLNHISENDLTYEDLSYKNCYELITEFNENVKTFIIEATLISFTASFLINYLLLPLALSSKRTLGMIMLRLNNIDTEKMSLVSNGRASILAVYKLFANCGILPFIPLLTIELEYIFNLPLLIWLGVVCVLIQVVSLIVLVGSSTDQTLIDKVTKTAIITNSDLDEIYRSKGYLI